MRLSTGPNKQQTRQGCSCKQASRQWGKLGLTSFSSGKESAWPRRASNVLQSKRSDATTPSSKNTQLSAGTLSSCLSIANARWTVESFASLRSLYCLPRSEMVGMEFPTSPNSTHRESRPTEEASIESTDKRIQKFKPAGRAAASEVADPAAVQANCRSLSTNSWHRKAR